jgi:hypothetical protein
MSVSDAASVSPAHPQLWNAVQKLCRFVGLRSPLQDCVGVSRQFPRPGLLSKVDVKLNIASFNDNNWELGTARRVPLGDRLRLV